MDAPDGYGGGLGRESYGNRKKRGRKDSHASKRLVTTTSPGGTKTTTMDDPKTPTGRRHSNSKKRRRSPNGETTVGNPTPRTSLAPRTTSPRPPVPPRYGRADANREIFLERERKAGQTFQ